MSLDSKENAGENKGPGGEKKGDPFWQTGETFLAAGLLYNGEDGDAVAKIPFPIANHGRQ